MKTSRFLALAVSLIGLLSYASAGIAQQKRAAEDADLSTLLHQIMREQVQSQCEVPFAVNPEFDRAYADLALAFRDWNAINSILTSRMADCRDDACATKAAGQMKPGVFVRKSLLETAAASFRALTPEKSEAVSFQKDSVEAISRSISFYRTLVESPSKQGAVEITRLLDKEHYPKLPEGEVLEKLGVSEAFWKAMPDSFNLERLTEQIFEATNFDPGWGTLSDGKTLWDVPQDSLAYKWGFRTGDTLEEMAILITTRQNDRKSADGALKGIRVEVSQDKVFAILPLQGSMVRVPFAKEKTGGWRLPLTKVSTNLMQLVMTLAPNERFAVRIQRQGETAHKEITFDLKGQPELRERLENFTKAVTTSSSN